MEIKAGYLGGLVVNIMIVVVAVVVVNIIFIGVVVVVVTLQTANPNWEIFEAKNSPSRKIAQRRKR